MFLSPIAVGLQSNVLKTLWYISSSARYISFRSYCSLILTLPIYIFLFVYLENTFSSFKTYLELCFSLKTYRNSFSSDTKKNQSLFFQLLDANVPLCVNTMTTTTTTIHSSCRWYYPVLGTDQSSLCTLKLTVLTAIIWYRYYEKE